MNCDVVEMRDFYQTQLGGMLRFFLKRHIDKLWPDFQDQTVLGLGYVLPYWSSLNTNPCLMAAMPARMGVIGWHHGDAGNRTLLVDDSSLPFPDQSVDRIFLMHALEYAENPDRILAEIWRVLKPEGRLLLVLPNRRGLWARSDNTPLGHGHPYTMTQLHRLLNNNAFISTQKFRAIYFPPLRTRLIVPFAHIMEAIGEKTLGKFSGIIGIEAVKKVYGGVIVHAPRGFKRPVIVGGEVTA